MNKGKVSSFHYTNGVGEMLLVEASWRGQDKVLCGTAGGDKRHYFPENDWEVKAD